jgi:hypothetical protein
MAERTEERTRDRESGTDTSWTDVDVEGLLNEETDRSERSARSPDSSPGGGDGGGFRTRLRDRRRELFSARTFVGVLALALGAGFLGGVVPLPLISGFAGLLGVFAAAFVVGLVSSKNHYLEAGLAGAAAAGITLVVTSLNIVFIAALRDIGPEIGVIGAGAGLLAGLLGHYFGRDLREGLTADI